MDKRYDQQLAEPAAQEKWLKEQTYAHENNPGQLYSIDTPPPTVSGSLHIGHIFSYTQTDIIARYKRMSGFSVFYPFGFDDNGLPTERYVEKKKKIRAHQLPRSEFIKVCLEETVEVEEEFKKLWQRMGLSADWRATYATISDSSRKISQSSFLQLFEKDFVYRKQEPALYCTTCRTSVAQAELDDVEKPSFFNDIVFKDQNGNDLIIGTTRPELLSSCVAMIFNPNDERYQHLRGQKAIVPIFGNEVPILEDEQVDIEKGTGLVMCCTFGDKTDIEWYKKFKLPYRQSIGFDGKWVESTGILAGLKTHDARKKIIEVLQADNLLINQRPISHAVNTHERCKKEIEFMVLRQWFVKVLEHKKKFLELADQIAWSPSFMKARYKDWVENLGWDWCISRQRFYGIPFPVWHCQDCNHVLLADEKDLPIDPQETAYDKPCAKCGGSNIVPDTDVMDTWNTSALTPYICANLFNPDGEAKDFLPMSMRPQAHDIIRTWAFYSITRAWMHDGVIPWKEIVISGHVLADNAKEKLSKSKGGGKLAPETLLNTYPADAIRYWTASGSLGHDVAFSESQLKIGVKLVTKLWNAFRFTKDHIAALEDPKTQPQDLGAINKWLLHTASECFERYSQYFEKNEFGHALSTVETFFWQNFCDTYLELIKHQLFNSDEYTAEQVRATRYTLYHTGLRILQLYAPYAPHVTETLYSLMYREKEKTASLHQTRFADVQSAHNFEKALPTAQAVIDIAAQVRKLKTEKQLSLKTPLASLTLRSTTDLAPYATLLKGVTQAAAISFDATQQENQLVERDGAWHATLSLD